jgi:hypothetical protein
MSELTGTENQALLQALRNLWPILSKTSRTQAINIAEKLHTAKPDESDA